MDFKEKLKMRFKINRQGTANKSPASPSATSPTSNSIDNYNINAKTSVDMQSKLTIRHGDPEPTDDEILATIEDVYLGGVAIDTFDAAEHVLRKLDDNDDDDEGTRKTPDIARIKVYRARLGRQLEVVSERVSALILQKESAYVKELQTVHHLQNTLQEALTSCYEARRGLSEAQQQFTVASLGILSNYYKRQQLLGILKSLRMIKTLRQTDVRLREMLEEEDYPGAINLFLACQKAFLTFRHYNCISELSTKLQDTMEMIEEQLDVALSRLCTNFETNNYNKLQMAYQLLGKTQTAMDQLHMHFTTVIHNSAFTIVLGYVELCSVNADTSFHKRQYQDLCKFVTTDSFTPCLVDLCKSMWQIMHSYYRVIKWHEHYDTIHREKEEKDETSLLGSEANFNRRYVRQKLEHGLGRIWQDVQQKVKAYLSASDISNFKFDEFIRVLDLTNRLIEVGEEFCGSTSDGLQESIRRQSVNYFKNYHRMCVEELRTFLDNEGWELCPVKQNFTIFQLIEFSFLRHSKELSRRSNSSATSSKHSQAQEGFFQRFYDNGNPFGHLTNQDEEDQDVTQILRNEDDENNKSECDDSESDDDSDIADELKRDFVDERTGDIVVDDNAPPTTKYSKTIRNQALKTFTTTKGQAAPIITNTTLNVLRLFGKYMQMMSVLKPIAFDVLICMSQLFEYYMYAVHSFFGTDLTDIVGDVMLSDKFRSALRRIQENFIYDENDDEHQQIGNDHSVSGDGRHKDKVPKPNLSSTVNLSDRENLYGLAERMVAAESLIFLADQLKLLQTYLDSLIPSAKRMFLSQFYVRTVSTAYEQRNPVYMVVAARAIDYEQTLTLMAMVKWDVGDIMSQHSPYVDVLLREMQLFSMRLSEVSKRVPIPQEAYNILWSNCIRLTSKTFVEGFASARKCSNEGRALMQLDFQQFLIKLEKITELRPIPDKDYVESYVKAFYLPENNLEEWMIGHKEYSTKQLTSLVTCITHINKKARQKLLSLIEDIDKSKK